MRLNPMEHLKKEIQEILTSLGQPGCLIEFALMRDWEKIVGSQIAGRSLPLYLRSGTLTVAVYNSVWKHQLNFFKEDMRIKINAHLGQEKVTAVRFELRKKPSWPLPREKRIQTKDSAPSVEDQRTIEDACNLIKDLELREIVLRFLILQASLKD